MRIIAGSRKGKNLYSLKVDWIRPTSSKVKEFIFNYLDDFVDDTRVLDLFAGIGNLGIEALSRGAKEVIFVDREKNAINTIYKNLRLTQFEPQSKVFFRDSLKFLKNQKSFKFDLIFLDPPYKNQIISSVFNTIAENNTLADKGIIVFEHDARYLLDDIINIFKQLKTRKIGDTQVSFFINK